MVRYNLGVQQRAEASSLTVETSVLPAAYMPFTETSETCTDGLKVRNAHVLTKERRKAV